MISLDIYRGNALLFSVKPDNSSYLKQALMGDNLLSLQFTLDRMIELFPGDYTSLWGEAYYIHAAKAPNIKKQSRYGYDYEVQMVSMQYLLQNAQLLQLDAAGNYTQPSFSFYATAEQFIDLLIANATRTGIAWQKGGIIQTGYKNLTFDAVDCLSALGTLADEFETEWFVERGRINLAKKLTPKPYTFRYGKGNGAYSIERKPDGNSSIVTRLYVFGGEKNLPSTYRNSSSKLLLPAAPSPQTVSDVTYTVTNNGNGTQTMVFNWTAPTDSAVIAVTIFYRLTTGSATTYSNDTGSKASPRTLTVPAGIYEVGFRSETSGNDPATPTIIVTASSPYAVLTGTDQPYIEYNTDKYGIIEQTLTFDDIYPHRTGKVTGVDALNVYKFIDSTIDFDINQQLLPGTAAKVVFNTGQLAGYSFEISRFDNTTKEITINKNKDEKTLDIPSADFKPAIGDEYVLVDIIMPQSYIDAAEAQLLQKAQDYLNTYSAPVYAYSVDCDPIYFRQNQVVLTYGDVVTIIDTELGINRAIRILSVQRKLTDEYDYQLELGETVSPSVISQLKSGQASNSNNITSINSSLDNNKLLAGTNVGDFKVEQGTLYLKDAEVASNVSGMMQLYVDANGKVWKH